jgi:hypothetical protein
MTQYEAILKHLRKHGSATVRDLLRYTNYPSSRISEMTHGWGGVRIGYGGGLNECIERWWMSTRNGKRVRLYKLVRGK